MNNQTYTDEAYRATIVSIFHDTYYIDSSYSNKVALIRKYTEIIIRRLLGWENEKKMTLGDIVVKKALRQNGYTEKFFIDALEIIRKQGNNQTHTRLDNFDSSKECFKNVENALFNIYAYLFYKYFKKYKFGTKPEVLAAFSTLPPIVRNITLEHLYEDDNENYDVIDRLLLAKIKTFGFDDAESWLKRHAEWKDVYFSMPEFLIELKDKLDNDGWENLVSLYSTCLYDCLEEKINTLKKAGFEPPYRTFQEAITAYQTKGRLAGNNPGIMEFNGLMEFVYIGHSANDRRNVQ